MKYFILVCICLAPTLSFADASSEGWPQWRGPSATGVAVEGNPPIEWSEDKNVRWKILLPGSGFATPIVWGDRVFISAAVVTDQPRISEPTSPGPSRNGVPPTHFIRFEVLALNRETGNVIWRKIAKEAAPHDGIRNTASWAPNSAVTDGEHLFAFFGSRGLFCYDLDGNLKWAKDFGDLMVQSSFGEGSSPALHGNTIVVNWDHEGDSFIVALDKNTGEELWRNARDEGTSWSTPLVVVHGGQTQVITPAKNKTRSYDLKTGKLIWECGGMTANVIPTAVHANGLVYVTGTARGNGVLQAIDLDKAKGDITDSNAIVWVHKTDTPHIPSPLLMGDQVYFLKDRNGILSSLSLESGETRFGPQRLEGLQGVYASPVGAKDRIYLAGQNGATVVVKHGSSFELLATNVLDEEFNASPAIVDNEIYLRGRQFLYCIAED